MAFRKIAPHLRPSKPLTIQSRNAENMQSSKLFLIFASIILSVKCLKTAGNVRTLMTLSNLMLGDNADGSGFVSLVISPNATMPTISTGDSLPIAWMCNNTSPSDYPKHGMQIGLFVDKNTFITELVTPEFKLGDNHINMVIPRFRINNSSDTFHVKFHRGSHVYAESGFFHLHNNEQGETTMNMPDSDDNYEDADEDKEEDRQYIDYLISPKQADVYYTNQTMNIQFKPDLPLPPKKRILVCLSQVRNHWFDADCIERIMVQGPAATQTSVYWAIPDYITPGDNYVLKFYDQGWLSTDDLYQSAEFSIKHDSGVPTNNAHFTPGSDDASPTSSITATTTSSSSSSSSSATSTTSSVISTATSTGSSSSTQSSPTDSPLPSILSSK